MRALACSDQGVFEPNKKYFVEDSVAKTFVYGGAAEYVGEAPKKKAAPAMETATVESTEEEAIVEPGKDKKSWRKS